MMLPNGVCPLVWIVCRWAIWHCKLKTQPPARQRGCRRSAWPELPGPLRSVQCCAVQMLRELHSLPVFCTVTQALQHAGKGPAAQGQAASLQIDHADRACMLLLLLPKVAPWPQAAALQVLPWHTCQLGLGCWHRVPLDSCKTP